MGLSFSKLFHGLHQKLASAMANSRQVLEKTHLKEIKGVCAIRGEYALPGEKAIARLLSYLMIIGHIAAIVVSSESEGNNY